MMTDKRRFAAGMVALGEMHQKQVSKELMAEYWGLLKEQINDDEFEFACKQAMRSEWFPTPAALLKHAVGEYDAQVRRGAVTLFEQVVKATSYNPHIGTIYRGPKIETVCGPLAAFLFQAAGGASAFEDAARNPDQLTWVRKAFVDAAGDTAKHDTDTRKALASGSLQEMKSFPMESTYQPAGLPPGAVIDMARRIGSGVAPTEP